MVGTYLKMLSLRPLDELEALLAEHAAAPERRLAQRALADELTEMVHGAPQPATAVHAAEVLFGGDPTWRLRRGARRSSPLRCPTSTLPADVDGVRVHELLVGAGLGEVEQRGQPPARPAVPSVPGTGCSTTTASCAASDLLSGGFVLLRKGKRDYLVGKVADRG